ncbi:MAG: HAMP domain-containing sensor histidine kinase [Chloroflexi bacterium]|nr:HAMP domain-containing sensor histidine kinase [Chloroflexota bacterium]
MPIELQLAKFLLNHHKIAYAITDYALNVVELGGELALLPPIDEACKVGNGSGLSLFEIAPEIIGCEAEILSLLQGDAPVFLLPLVNRESAQATLIYVNLTCLPHKDAAGQITGILHIVEDVTTHGRLEQRLTQQRNELSMLRDQLGTHNLALTAANIELHNLDEIKSKFVSIAAHELRNPLASILGYVEMLEEDLALFHEEHAHYIKAIHKSAKRVLSITNDLLDVTRIESGRLELILKSTNLVEMLEDVADELQPQLEAKHQSLLLDSTPDVPLAFCDNTRTFQILANLLSNAIKYTPEEGQITLCLDAQAEEGFIVVSVADTGIGISQNDQGNLFRSFFRGSNTHLTSATGAGLGLSIAKSLVELQGGRIWLTSELNQGSTFYVTIPIDDNAANENASDKNASDENRTFTQQYD